MFVVYLDQCLGAAHSKHWLKYVCSRFLQVFDAKMMKHGANLGFVELIRRRWSTQKSSFIVLISAAIFIFSDIFC